jgi:beta-N-acetylhexosaminidase
MINNNNIEQKIGQMINIGFYGDTTQCPTVKKVLEQIAKARIGGVTLFSSNDNIKNPLQLKTLIQNLKASAKNYPLSVAVDQEGGILQRLNSKNGFPNFKTAKYVAENMSTTEAYQMYNELAGALAEVGINFNFAPVLDIRRDYKSPAITKKRRSFGKTPEVVIKFARQCIKAHDAQQIITSLKHFPGHGSARADSHLGFVDVTNDWQDSELIPYQTLIAEGLARSIMVAHIFNTKLDSQLPASLSKNIVGLLLREKLGFNGVVVSDDFHMGAIRNNFSLEATVINAIKAGVDILVFSNNLGNPDLETPQKVISIAIQAIKDGLISEEQIDRSFARIVSLKDVVA